MRPRSDASPGSRPALTRALDVALLATAIAGLLSVVWAVLSVGLGLGLVSFATGSMAPRFPVGSIAVSAPVPLRSVHVGDVVTVARGPGQLPITHRVVAIAVAPSQQSAVLRLKGDANRVPDPASYSVTALRRVVLPLPPIAGVLRFTSTIPVMVGIGLVIVGSIAWAFWPERIRPRHRHTAPVLRRPVGRHAAS